MNRATLLGLFLVVLSPWQLVSPSSAAERLEYNRDIRPILAENCFACHGPDSAARKANLRLDLREEAVKLEAIVPGHPEKSQLVERIFATDTSHLMPPPKSHKRLTTAQKETLRRWIASGAEYQPHWSFLPPKRPALPTVKDAGWARTPLDRFILAELEKRGLTPAPEADRYTLARRVSLDLTGLPPAHAVVEAFVNDRSTDAYERFVDQLLKSPHWGEHRGRYWLDAARYADTHGIHFDNMREMWSYRDWVIGAFNRNLPFDQFTVEQLAGDLLPNPTLDQRVATGFHRCNITTNEGGVIAEEYLVHYTRDRTETTGQVWLGLSAGCAVCHDHKFDPLSQREFYEMAAFFNNTTQGAMDGNIKDTPPVLVVPQGLDRIRWETVSRELAELRQNAAARKGAVRGTFDQWLGKMRPGSLHAETPHDGLAFHALLAEGSGSAVTVTVNGQQQQVLFGKPAVWQPGRVAASAYRYTPETVIEVDRAGDFERDQPFSFGAWVRIPRRGTTGAVFARMDDPNGHRGWDLWIEGDRVGAHIIHHFPEDALKVLGQTQLQPNQWYHLLVTYDGSGKAAGVRIYVNGNPEPAQVLYDQLRSTIRTGVPFKVGRRHTSSEIANLLVQDVRLYNRALGGVEAERLTQTTRAAWLTAQPTGKRTPAEQEELLDWWLVTRDEPYQTLSVRITALNQEEAALRARGTIAHVMQERPEEAMAHVLFRGDYDKRRDAVKPGTPKFLPPLRGELPKNRLGFAQWLLKPENPLTARVTVNRFWQEVFGTGLVRTSGDFGVAGELPSHPELLDWLAVEFRESGWDMKKFFKMVVMSATYRQAAITTPEKREKDPHNRFLSRGPRFRMDGEMIRDYALATSGILVPKIGGPSVKPYQPEGVWEAVAMIGSNTRDYRRDTGENLYRRSMYTFWKRSAPPASMDIFNAPNRETCAVRRERTNTPLQALVTLNDVQFVEAARHLAQTALQSAGKEERATIDYLAKRLLARSFRTEELAVVDDSLKELLEHYKANPEDAKKLIAVGESKANPNLDAATLAAWTMLVNELMNLDEVLNK